MDEAPKIKVTDRRLFTADGRLRDESEASAEDGEQPSASSAESAPRDGLAGDVAAAVADQPEPRTPGPQAAPAGFEPEAGGGQVSFFDLVGLLAEPVALFLGDLALPNGERQVDLGQARLHIDLLDMLQEKTRGNLNAEEEAVLSDLVYRLKMRYVQKRESA